MDEVRHAFQRMLTQYGVGKTVAEHVAGRIILLIKEAALLDCDDEPCDRSDGQPTV